MFKPTDHIAGHADDYWHELLSARDTAHVDRHCETCATCQAALKDALKRLRMLERVPAVEVPARLVQAALDHIDQTDRRRRRFRRRFFAVSFLAAAVAALSIGAWNIWCLRLAPTPYELRLLGQNQLLAGAHASLRVLLTNHETTQPLAGIPVAIELRNRRSNEAVQLARFTTNDQGTGEPRFLLPDWSEDECELRVTADLPDRPEITAQTVRLQRSAKLLLTCDKPVYQPGQTIRVRALALWKANLKPAADEPLAFSISDPRGNVIFKQQPRTSRFGISAIDCPLASEILEGPYTITAQLGNTESKLAVQVFKYVLPKFTLDVTLDRSFYQPGQTVKGTVQANYVFGNPVAQGDVEVRVLTNTAGTRELAKLTARTDAMGKMEFQFPLPEAPIGQPESSGDARVRFEVSVKDSADQQYTRTAECLVTARPLRVEVIPEAGTLVPGVTNRIYLFVTRADGTPVPKAKLTVYAPNTQLEIRADELGVALLETGNSGLISSFAVVIEAEGLRVKGPQGMLVPGPAGADFLVRTERAVYDSGETLHLSVFAGGVQPVFIDFLKDGQTIRTDAITPSPGGAPLAFDLPAELSGPLQISAYRFTPDGFPVRRSRVLFVRPASQVKLHARPDQETYRPGRPAKVNFTLTDDQGQPTPGAVSLSVVDKAVFAVLDQSSGLARTFDQLDKQLMQPVYALYPWSPFEPSRGPRDQWLQFEQALFARTAEDGSRTLNSADVARRSGNGPWAGAATQPGVSLPPTYSLAAESFSEKTRQVEADRKVQFGKVEIAWLSLAVGLCLMFSLSLWLFVRPLSAVWLAHFCMGVVAVACLLVEVGSNANGTFTRISTGGDAWRLQSPPADMDRAMNMDGPPPGKAEGNPPGRAPAVSAAPAPQTAEPVRVREYFPETLRWEPQLITDDAGHAVLDLELADSITTWDLRASAVTLDGRLGAASARINVFQPFFVDLNLPRTLTRKDEIAIPVVVYNYDGKPQTVRLALTVDAANPWFTPLDGLEKTVELKAGEVRTLDYRIRVEKVGEHELTVTAHAGDLSDAIKRTIEVVPDGRRIDRVVNGSVEAPVNLPLEVPADAIEGSPKAILKIYSTGFSQLIEGLDNIFRLPSGCFEQTSSTTYPNVLALDYLQRTKKSVPEVEVKARQYIHLGYQRLLSFEIPGGGFDWFGHPPANRTLTAYGLMEFRDMARVHDVDPQLIERTRNWLLRQRQRDGSWLPEGHGMHDDPTRGRAESVARLSTTAYIAWAVYGGKSDSLATRQYLLAHPPETLDDPYVLALVSNALLAIDSQGDLAAPYLDRLEGLRLEEGKSVFWKQPTNARTAFYGAGRSGNVETTALAALAMLQVRAHAVTAGRALDWLVKHKDASGTWYSTQATVLALKALVASTEVRPGDSKERRLRVKLGEQTLPDVVLPPDQSDVMRQVDLSRFLHPGSQVLTLQSATGSAVNYQIDFRYHVPGAAQPAKDEPLAIRLEYDRADLEQGQIVKATATVTNRMKVAAPMVMLDLPIPAGFALEADDLTKARAANKNLAKFQVLPRQVVVYLTGLQPDETLTLEYRLKATMPVKVSVPPARVYEYYDSDKQGFSAPGRFTVR